MTVFLDVLDVSSVLGDSLFRLEYCRDRSDTSLSFCSDYFRIVLLEID